MKVTAILKGRTDSNGHLPVQIRISIGEKRMFKPTQIKIDPTLFENGRVKKQHPKASEYNRRIEYLIIQFQAQALNGFEKKAPKVNLYDYIQQTVRHLTRGDETLRQYRSQVNKLKGFKPVVFLNEIDHRFFNEYKSYLIKRGNDNNTRWSAFKFLKTFIKKAVNDDLIIKDPRKNYEFPKYIETTKNYLTLDELKKIEKFIKGKVSPELKQAGGWYLIGCYSGLRISDKMAFDKKKHIVNGRLIVKTKKTGEIVSIPVEGKLKEYFEFVNYQAMTMHPNNYNKLLKVIALSAGIDKRIHAHLSRHTAAMRLANAGVSQEVAAKILGHASMKSTNVYYKISNTRVDKELKKIK